MSGTPLMHSPSEQNGSIVEQNGVAALDHVVINFDGAETKKKLMGYQKIIAEQREFFATGATRPYEHRIKALKDLHALLWEGRDRLMAAASKDLHRDPRITDYAEVRACMAEITNYLDNLKEWMKPEKSEVVFNTMLDSVYTVREPYGTTIILGPFNYPISLVVLPLIPLIAAGNTVIMKPSELTPNVTQVMEDLFKERFHEKFLAVVQADGPKTAEILKERFDYIVYTGSTQIGSMVMKAAAQHVTPVVLELGGKCPVIVESDTDLRITAKRLMWGKFFNNGQTCLAPDYLITTPAVKRQLISLFDETLNEFYGGKPHVAEDYNRIVNTRHFDRLASLLDQSKGRVAVKHGERDRADLFIPPTIIEVEKGDVLLRDELFGPVLPILTVADFDEALDYIRQGEKPLSAYLFTKDNSKVERLIAETQSGSVVINDVVLQFTLDTVPFGGIGASGIGQYRGKYGFESFSHRKSVLKRNFFGDSLLAARYPPLTDSKYRTMLRFTVRRAIPNVLGVLKFVPFILLGVFLHAVVSRMW